MNSKHRLNRVDCLVRGEHQATKGKRPLTTEDQGTQAMTIIITTISSRVNKMTIIMIVIVISVTRLLDIKAHLFIFLMLKKYLVSLLDKVLTLSR